MRDADEIAASLLERRRTTSARGWFDDLQKDITAAITAARRDGAEQMRAECAKQARDAVANGIVIVTGDEVYQFVLTTPLPGDEPKEHDHAK